MKQITQVFSELESPTLILRFKQLLSIAYKICKTSNDGFKERDMFLLCF